MEALTDDIVFSLSAFLRPHDLFHLALTSRRFGGSPGGAENGARVLGADAEERAAKRRRHDDGAWKSDGFADVSLMEEVARKLVEGRRNFSSGLLQRQGDESWMAVLHRLEWQQQLIEEAMAAAPALFAKPGDQFYSRNSISQIIEDSRVEYVGRKVDGWLHFRNGGDGDHPAYIVINRTKLYSHYSGMRFGDRIEYDENTLNIPPEECGNLNLLDEGTLIHLAGIKERVKETFITAAMLEEAKRAVPVLVANPGDLFAWHRIVIRYIGRNEVPPIAVDGRRRPITGPQDPQMVDSAQIGWLVFHLQDDFITGLGCIRGRLGASPEAVYSHYDKSGKRIRNTLCIPPEKCGALKAYFEPDPENDGVPFEV